MSFKEYEHIGRGVDQRTKELLMTEEKFEDVPCDCCGTTDLGKGGGIFYTSKDRDLYKVQNPYLSEDEAWSLLIYTLCPYCAEEMRRHDNKLRGRKCDKRKE